MPSSSATPSTVPCRGVPSPRRGAAALSALALALSLSGCEIGRQAPPTPRDDAAARVTASVTPSDPPTSSDEPSPGDEQRPEETDGAGPTEETGPTEGQKPDDGKDPEEGKDSQGSTDGSSEASVQAPAPTPFTAQWVPTGTVRGTAATNLGWHDGRLTFTPGADAQTCEALAARSAVDADACLSGGGEATAVWGKAVTGSLAVVTDNGAVGRVTAPAWVLFRLCATDPSEEEQVVAFLLDAPELTLPDGIVGMYGCHDLALVDRQGERLTQVHTLPASGDDAVVPGRSDKDQ